MGTRHNFFVRYNTLWYLITNRLWLFILVPTRGISGNYLRQLSYHGVELWATLLPCCPHFS